MASKPNCHCITSIDLSKPTAINTKFDIDKLRKQHQLIWDANNYKKCNEKHCTPKYWSRIRAAHFAANNVEYYNSNRILFRTGGYYQSQIGPINKDYNTIADVLSLCDSFDIDNKHHIKLPNLPEALHSSSLIYINELQYLLNIGGENFDDHVSSSIFTLKLDESIKNDDYLKWDKDIIPNMNQRRSYRPSVGIYKDAQIMKLFVCGGSATNYIGLKSFESLDLRQWIQNKNSNNIHTKWVKEKSMKRKRRDSSNLLHWNSMASMVICGGDHGSGLVINAQDQVWKTSERFDLHKQTWCKLPNFPWDTYHAQNPFIWIEGGINDNNNWSGIRETKLFKNYSSFDASFGVLCIIGNGFCHNELGVISFYDPRTNKWECGGKTERDWIGLETHYLGVLDDKQELRTICATT